MRRNAPGKLKNHQLRRARRLVILEATLGGLTGQLTAGILLVKFATELGAGPGDIAIMQAIPQFISTLQIFSSWLIGQTGDCKRLVLSLMVLNRLVWMSIGMSALFLLRPGVTGPVWALIAANGVAALSAQMAVVAAQTWIAELAPVSFWGRFLGRKNMLVLLFATPVGIGAGLYADWWFNHMPKGDLRGPGGMAVLGSLLGLAGLWVLSRVPAITIVRTEASLSFGQVLRKALRDTSFRRLALTRCWIMFFVQVAAPMWQFFAMKYLNVPLLVMKLWESVANVSNAGGNRLCGRLADRHGYRPVAVLFCIGMGTIPVWWMLTSPATWVVPLGAVTLVIPCYWIAVLSQTIGSFSWAGVNLCASNLALKLAEREHRAAYVALFQAAFGVTGGLGALAGGALVTYAKTQLRPDEIELAFKILFLLSALGRWAAMIGLASVREPGATPVGAFALALLRDPLGRRQVIPVAQVGGLANPSHSGAPSQNSAISNAARTLAGARWARRDKDRDGS